MPDVVLRPLRALVETHRDQIKAIVARHHGHSVAIFGSVARGDELPGSDIDFLVELAPDARPIEILSIGVELEEALGVKVDVAHRRRYGNGCETRSSPRRCHFEPLRRSTVAGHRRGRRRDPEVIWPEVISATAWSTTRCAFG